MNQEYKDKIQELFGKPEEFIRNTPGLRCILQEDKLTHFSIGCVVTSVVLVVTGSSLAILTGAVIGLVKETYDGIMEHNPGDPFFTSSGDEGRFNIPDLISWVISSLVVVVPFIVL